MAWDGWVDDQVEVTGQTSGDTDFPPLNACFGGWYSPPHEHNADVASPKRRDGTPTRGSPRGVHGKATEIVTVVRVRREIKWRVPHDRIFSEWKVSLNPSSVGAYYHGCLLSSVHSS